MVEPASLIGGIGSLVTPAWSTAVTVNTDTWVSWNVGATGGGLGGLGYQTAAANYATNTVVWNSWVQVAAAMQGPAAQQSAPANTPWTEHQYRLDAAKRELNRQRSVRRARRLLEEILSPEQREQLRAHGFFVVEHGVHKYRINRGRTHNVYLLDAVGRAIENLCIVPEDYAVVPEEDCMIAQKLLLEADHNAFRTIANIGRYPTPMTPMMPGRSPTARAWLQVHRRARTRRAA